jgi:hypothetical protein
MGTLADRIGTSYDREAVRPRNGGRMFRYKMHYQDGSEAGDAAYADICCVLLQRPVERRMESAGIFAAW